MRRSVANPAGDAVLCRAMQRPRREKWCYAEPGKLARLVAQAGAAGVSERGLDFRIEAPIGPKEYWPVRFELSEMLRAAVLQLSPERLRSARSEVEEAVRPYFPEGRMSFPAQAILVAARK